MFWNIFGTLEIFLQLCQYNWSNWSQIIIFLFCFWQAELTFCAGDVVMVFGEIDEDGFYFVSKNISLFYDPASQIKMCLLYMSKRFSL